MTDWTDIYESYKGLWVALLEDQETVVGKGRSMSEARQDAARKGYEEVFLMSVPQEVLTFVG